MLTRILVNKATDLTSFHFAVLSRSYDSVYSSIQRGELNVDDDPSILSPLECALGWPKGIRLLVEAGCNPTLAVQLAIFRYDVDSIRHIMAADPGIFFDEIHGNVNRNEDRAKDGPNLLKTLLCSTCCWWPVHAYPRRACGERNLSNCCDRRTRLARLALENLPPPTAHRFGLNDINRGRNTLDENAFRVYLALLDAGVQVPKSLYPGRSPLLLSFNIGCGVEGLNLFRSFFEERLCEADISPRHGAAPLLVQVLDSELTGVHREEALQILLAHGSSMHFTLPEMPNLLFYLAREYDPNKNHKLHQPREFGQPGEFRKPSVGWRQFYRVRVQIGSPESGPTCYFDLAVPKGATRAVISRAAQQCDPVQRDSCECWCSSGGCLPLHRLLHGGLPQLQFILRSHYMRGNGPLRCWQSFSTSVWSWIRACGLANDSKETREYLYDACRLEVFTRLGMAHTCCMYQRGPSQDCHWPQRWMERRTMSEETRHELRHEDEESCEQLEAILQAYDKALSNWLGPGLDEFWKWWCTTLEPLLPENALESDDHDMAAYVKWSNIPPEASASYEFYRRHRPRPNAATWNNEAHGVLGTQHVKARVDLIEEIKQYFDGVFSGRGSGTPTPLRPACSPAPDHRGRRCLPIEKCSGNIIIEEVDDALSSARAVGT
ncbi:hypothetical protein B0J18DRAFT_169920 [Chaetomium sp. MPI-SDFR-AT-0129]|nr:hypothetical protein B0J18DRAFT_169920 [Chaetomium sp. MPI-SDFR-AT-0129]